FPGRIWLSKKGPPCRCSYRTVKEKNCVATKMTTCCLPRRDSEAFLKTRFS
ncbi:hypothetical protein KIL84_018019, partial [Mauremys mutica]